MTQWITSLNSLFIETHTKNHLSSLQYKVLLLGCGHVGKSTIFKQLNKIYGGGYETSESTAKHIQDAIIAQMKNLLCEMQRIDGILDWDNWNRSSCALNDDAKQSAAIIEMVPPDADAIDSKHDLQTLWNDESIKQLYNTHSTIAIADSDKYFYNDLERVLHPHYKPTDKDIIYSYIPTTGIRDRLFNINKNCTMNVFDTGGQRSERYKWIHCFDSPTHCMVFVVSLNHFDQRLYEENDANGLHESLNLFECLINGGRWFNNSTVVLVLNFMDLFEDKIENKGKSLTDYFDEYEEYKLSKNHHKNDIINHYLRNVIHYIHIIPPLVVHLCAMFYNNEAKLSLDFIIHQFKAMVPSERLNKFHIYPTVCIEEKNVHKIYDDIGNILVSNYPHKDYWFIDHNVYTLIEEGRTEIMIAFPLVILSLIVICIMLIFIPYYALSYLEMVISLVLLMITMCYGRIKHQYTLICKICIIITALMGIFNVVQVILYQSNNKWSWVVYIWFPIGSVSFYLVIICNNAFYWYWHQIWTIFWFGITMIAVGFSIEVNINYAIWIIGTCFVMISIVLPFTILSYLKKEIKNKYR